MHDPRSVANQFIQRAIDAGKPTTPLQVQKLVFLAHGWMLGLHDRPLIDEDLEVWRYGPVIASIYHCLSHYRKNPVLEPIRLHEDDDQPFDAAETNMIDDVFKLYGGYTGVQLSSLTHVEGSPYRQAKRRGLIYIPENIIKSYYKQQVKEARAKQRG